MAFLFNMFKSKPVAPPRFPTDEVIPMSTLDDSKVLRSLCMDFTMRFDEKLDVDKLVGALEKLLSMPGWKKLGARLRLNENDKLEYHVPAQFTSNRPAFDFTHVKHAIRIADDPLLSQLPTATPNLTVGSQSQEKFQAGLLSPNCPRTLEEWIFQDRGQLVLHVVGFEDATLVTLSWMHTLLDAMGRNALLRAWTAVLEGRDEDVPEVWGYDFNPLDKLGATAQEKEADGDKEKVDEEEEYVLKKYRLRGWAMFRWVIAYIWELVVYRAEEQRIIIVPASFFSRLRSAALKDLETAPADIITYDTRNPEKPKPFVSDGDILLTWWARQIFTNQPWSSSASPNKIVLIMNVFNMRNLLGSTEPVLLPKDKAYLHNAAMSLNTFVSYGDLLAAPLGHLAARSRMSLVQQTTRAQIEAARREAKIAVEQSGQPPLYSPSSDMVFTAISNWTKGKMFETDFSAAVVANEEHANGLTNGANGDRKQRTRKPGRPSAIYGGGLAKGFSLRNSGACFGQDAEGNFWVSASLRPVVWQNIENAFRGM